MSSQDHSSKRAVDDLRAELSRERAAREAAEAQLRRLTSVTIIGVCTTDLDWRVLEANDAFLRMLGGTREELRGRTLDLMERTPAAARDEARRLQQQLLETGELTAREATLGRLDGKLVPVLLSAARLPGSSAVVIFAHDLSETRRKEGLLESAEARLTDFLKAVPAMLIEFDRDGSVTFFRAAEKLDISMSLSESLFSRWAERPDILALLRRSLAGEVYQSRVQWKSTLFDLSLAPRDPSDLPRRDSLGDGGPVIRCVAVDVTRGVRAVEERQRLEEWLAQEHQLDGLGVLTAGLAHTFNNLLAGVVANASAALQGLPREHLSAGALEDLLTSASRAASLAGQLIQTSIQKPAQSSQLDLTARLQELGPLLVSAMPKSVRLELRLAEAMPRIHAHPEQLRRALLPLITGAIEAAKASGTAIRIATSLVEIDPEPARDAGVMVGAVQLTPGWYVSVAVIDDGPIPNSAQIAELLDPLAKPLPSPRALSFAAALGSMRAQRGGVRLQVSATSTQVELLYPADAFPAQHQPLRTPRGPARAREVLIVDDDAVVRRAAGRILGAIGLPFCVASSGAQALERLRIGPPPGLVLLDFAMPGLNGEQTLRAMKLLHPELRILLCSGYSEEESTWAIDPGLLSGFLAKPFTAQSLQEAVLRTLDGLAPGADS